MKILHIQQGELAYTQGAQFFFFGEGGGCGIFLVPIVFPISYQQFLKMFPKFPMCSPTCSPYFVQYDLPLTSTLVTYISSPKEETTTVYINLGTVESLIKFSVLGESKVPITKEKNCTEGFGGGLHN